MNLLERLWALADDLAASGRTNVALFGECGLFLQRPLVRWDYFCTPLNTLTFASTGGDGVHYGLLQSSSVPYDQLPIVMTVPMSDQHNTVVAETLKEFLGLGYYVGWFSLEQLIYDANWAVTYFSQPDSESDWAYSDNSPDAVAPEYEKVLQMMWLEKEEEIRVIRETLQIEYTSLSVERIKNLNEKYLSLLRLP